MTKNKRFEFREINCTAIVPKVYDTEKQQYANLFECVHWLNNLHEESMQLKQKVNFYKYFQKDARELEKENEQLKKEKEFWKSDACSLSSLNSILSNELSIAQEQGYEPSKPYKEYIASIKTEYDKFWENKIKTHNNRLNGVRE